MDKDYAQRFKNQLTYLFLVILFLWGMATTAHADNPICYTADEYMAEQTLRFQTQLMVIAVMCDRYADAPLYAQYQTFSKHHEDYIHNQERVLIDYFDDQDDHAPKDALHNTRTVMANDMARHIAQKNPRKFCGKFISRIDQANNMKDGELPQWINHLGWDKPSNAPLCHDVAPAASGE